jgi:solute carrier family 50 protein (sugar transporter)
MILNTIMYGSPLNVMALVIRTKSVEFMPLSLTLGTLFCSATWGLYGIWIGDINIYLPNIAGIALGLVQVVLYSVYSGFCSKLSTPADDSFVLLADSRVPAHEDGEERERELNDQLVIKSD